MKRTNLPRHYSLKIVRNCKRHIMVNTVQKLKKIYLCALLSLQGKANGGMQGR